MTGKLILDSHNAVHLAANSLRVKIVLFIGEVSIAARWLLLNGLITFDVSNLDI